MTPEMRRIVLAVSLVGTLGAAYFAPEGDDHTVAVPAKVQDRAAALRRDLRQEDAVTRRDTPQAKSEAPEVVLQRPDPTEASKLFSSKNWMTPATPPAAPPVARAVASATPASAPPVAPVVVAAAPPLPFRSLGWYRDGERRGVFLQHNANSLVVHVGDKIGGDYVVESWTDRSLSVRYLPLNQLQTLEVGSYEN